MSTREPSNAMEPLALLDEELSGPIDLEFLAQEIGGGLDGAPGLVDRPSLVFSVASTLTSLSASTSVPSSNADAWEALATEMAEESRAAQDPVMRAALMCEAGRILVDRLGRQEDGRLLMRNSQSGLSAVLLSPRHEGNESLATQLQDLERTATSGTLDAAERAAAWVEFGLLCEEQVGKRDRALTAYKSALQLVPDHSEALSLAIDAAILLGERSDAIRYLEQKLSTLSDGAMRCATLLELAEQTREVAKRRELLEQALASQPNEETALRRLIRVVALDDDPIYLGALYRRLANIAQDPVSRATALHLAFITLSEAGEPVEPLVRDLADAVEGHVNAGEMLAPLSEVALFVEQRIAQRGPIDAARDVGLLERLVGCLDAPREQALVREQLARLRLSRLSEQRRASPDPSDSQTGLPKISEDRLELIRALEADLRFCIVHLPEHRWARSALADLLELRNDVNGLLVHLQEWAQVQAGGRGRAAILLRLGQAHEQLRKDLPRAAEVFELAVAEDPDDLACLRALGRVYERMRRWESACVVLQKQGREADDHTERVVALRRAAEIAENELGDLELAIAILEETSNLDGSDLLALFRLAALCRKQGRMTVLVTTLRRIIDRLEDERGRTSVLVELGEVLELHLRQRVPAREAYEQALALSPGYVPALQALARIYRDNGDLEALLALYEPSVDPISAPATLALKAARVCVEELGDSERAIGYLERAYRADPDLVSAREMLLMLYTSNGRLREAYDLLRAQEPPYGAVAGSDHAYRLGLLAEAIARGSEQESYELLDAALQHHRAALVADPTHELAFERCRRLLSQRIDLPNLELLLRSRLEAVQGEMRGPILTALARVYGAMGSYDQAKHVYAEASQLAPQDEALRREYEALLRRANDHSSLPAVYLASARASQDSHLRATLLVEAVELLAQSKREEDRALAVSSVLDALRDEPGNPYAVRHLERLLGDPDLTIPITDAVAARAVRAQSDAERAVFYQESAELLEHGGALGAAKRAYQAALQAMPGLLPADLGARRSAAAREATGTRAKAKPAMASLHNLMAEARDEAVRSGSGQGKEHGLRAIQILGEILARDPEHQDALGLARALTGQLGDPTPALTLLATAFPRVTAPELRYELALLLGENAPRAEQAIEYYREALRARPTGGRALRALISTYRQQGRDAEAAELTEQLLQNYDPGDAGAVDLRIGVARFLGRTPATLPRALEHARIVLRARPEDGRALALMADLLERNKQRVDAAQLLDRLIARERDRTKQHELLLRQARLLASSGAHQDAALRAIERAAELNPGHRETIRLLTVMFEQAGRIDRLVTYLPPIRAALQANLSRGAVSIRDLRGYGMLARHAKPGLAEAADLAAYALDPTSTPPPDDHLRSCDPKGLRRILESSELRARVLVAAETRELHELLQSVDPIVPRMESEFPALSEADLVHIPPTADPNAFAGLLGGWARAAGFDPPTFAAVGSSNTAVWMPGRPPVLRISSTLWQQGDLATHRGLASLTLARAALLAPVARGLHPLELDLLIAGCFETVGVFNAITADPDQRRLREVVTGLNKLLPRRNRKTVERACAALSGLDLVPGQCGMATLDTDLRLAVVMTADVSGVLAAASALDGVMGGSLKQRTARSRAAQQLIAWIVSDDYAELRAIARNGA